MIKVYKKIHNLNKSLINAILHLRAFLRMKNRKQF